MAESPVNRSFNTVVMHSSALCIGVTAGFVASIESINPTFRLDLWFGSWVAFAAGMACTYWFFRALLHRSRSTYSPRLVVWGFVALAGTATLGAFAYGLKDVPTHKLIEILWGVGFAALFLSFFLVLFLGIVSYLKTDHEQNAIYPDDLRDDDDDKEPDWK